MDIGAEVGDLLSVDRDPESSVGLVVPAINRTMNIDTIPMDLANLARICCLVLDQRIIQVGSVG